MIRTEELIEAARAAAARAYAPYSRFKVGAAIQSGDAILTGCNIENASYGLTVCAERNAVAALVDSGRRHIDAIAIYTETDALTPPCGACRQVLSEFPPAEEGRSARVILAGLGGKTKIYSLEELLPHRFEFDARAEG